MLITVNVSVGPFKRGVCVSRFVTCEHVSDEGGMACLSTILAKQAKRKRKKETFFNNTEMNEWMMERRKLAKANDEGMWSEKETSINVSKSVINCT